MRNMHWFVAAVTENRKKKFGFRELRSDADQNLIIRKKCVTAKAVTESGGRYDDATKVLLV